MNARALKAALLALAIGFSSPAFSDSGLPFSPVEHGLKRSGDVA